MSCQLIRASEWDQMVESGRVAARAGVAVGTASADVPRRPPSPPAGGRTTDPDPDPDPDTELVTLLASVRDAERQLQGLLARLQTELDRRQPGWSGRKRRNRRLLVTTKTEEKAIAAPASIGLSRPAAASGRAATL